MYDVAIIGAGPAGATLARLIGRDYRVLLLDKRNLSAPPGDKWQRKCCGGLVAPAAQKALASMGLGLPRSVLVGPQVFAVRAMDFDNGLERYYQRHYLNVDRGKFDRWLVSLAAPLVDLRDGCMVTDIETRPGRASIRFTQNGKAYWEQAKLLVAADGANSLVRRLLSLRRTGRVDEPDKYIAIQEWFRAEAAPPYFAAIFDKSVTDFYSWMIPKGSALLVGSAIRPGRDARRRFELLKSKLVERGVPLGRSLKREAAFIYRPRRMRDICTSAGGVAFVGEAAGWISPTSGEGISFAFRSAAKLAGALGAGLMGFERRYAMRCWPLKLAIANKNARGVGTFTPLLRGLVMRSGLNAVPVAAGETNLPLRHSWKRPISP